jgi:hypothetical protein
MYLPTIESKIDDFVKSLAELGLAPSAALHFIATTKHEETRKKRIRIVRFSVHPELFTALSVS